MRGREAWDREGPPLLRQELCHDPALPGDRSPFGPARTGDRVNIRLRRRGGAETLPPPVLCLAVGEEEARRRPMEAVGDGWQAGFTAPAQPVLLHYWFETAGRGPEQKFPLTVYAADFTTPDWLSQGVLYQIFPDRFAPGDPALTRAGLAYHHSLGRDFRWHHSWQEEVDWQGPDYQPLDVYGGSLAAITRQLDYLAYLGVTVIYLNPIFEAASNHSYF